MLLETYKGVLVRPEFPIDREMVKDCFRNYDMLGMDSDSVVLDLGANVGGFAVMCKKLLVKKYVGYEPDHSNFQVLEKNIEGQKDFFSVEAAASASEEKELTFYVRDSKRSKCAGTLAPKTMSKNITSVTVKNENIDKIIEKIKPTVLKMDIEGAERDIFEAWKGHIPECVEWLAIEIHTGTYVSEFEKTHHETILADGFDLITAAPHVGFVGKGKNFSHFGKAGNGSLFGFDLIYRRK